jgi:D-alanyl-D-alanine carboxypeptidase (penicillin-binding protein 5/6)
MGGSQVYLDPKEQFSVEDLLYALAIQSANDAAVALAMHVAGSTEEFINLMNQRAKELGMKDSQFHSVHGLPPSKGQKPDETTAIDLAILARELAKRPEIFEYTGIKERSFRDGKFIMRTHNHLLGRVNGCDGFKTGYFQAAGFSIVATAQRGGVRIIAIVMGSKDRKIRNAKAEELLAKGFALVPTMPDDAVVVSTPELAPEKIETADSPEVETFEPPRVQPKLVESSDTGWAMFFWGLAVGLSISGLLAIYIFRKRSRRQSNYRSYR